MHRTNTNTTLLSLSPEIIKPGRVDCVHHEHIFENIGECQNCGQIRRYPVTFFEQLNGYQVEALR